MNPFDPALGENDLIAYHLQELPARQARYVRRMLQKNAALAAESEAIAATLRAFPKDEASLPTDAGVRERYWLALLPSLTVHLPKPAARFGWLRKWRLPVLAGTAFAATAMLVSVHHTRHGQPPAAVGMIATIKGPSGAVLTPQPPVSSTVFNAPPSSASIPSHSNPRPWITKRVRSASSAHFGTGSLAAPLSSPPPTPSAPAAPAQRFSAQSSTGQSFSAQSSTTETAPASSATASPAAAAASLQASTKPHAPSHTGHHALSPFHHPSATDLTLGIFADLTTATSTASNSGTGTSLITGSNVQTASPAVGAFVSFHQQFRPWLGYRATATYFHPTFDYTSTSNGTYSGGLGLVNTLVYEFGGTYVVQGPHRRRFTPSVEAGASLLDFVPGANYSQTTSIRAAAIAGVGTEYSLTKRLSLRTEYRAQIYKGPAFSNIYVTGRYATTNLVFSSNPILGITYHFGARGDD